MFIGLDPSTRTTGAVILDRDGNCTAAQALTTQRSTSIAERLCELRAALEDFCKGWGIVCAAIEQPFIGRFAYASGRLFMVQGVCLVRLFNSGIPEIYPVSVAQAKRFATDEPRPQKDAIRLAVYKRWDWDHHSNDVTDAYVMAHVARAMTLGEQGGYDSTQLKLVQKIREKSYTTTQATQQAG